MSDPDTPADDRTAESADMVGDPAESDPADLDGAAASKTVDKMLGETDEIAEDADPDGPGHGAKDPGSE